MNATALSSSRRLDSSKELHNQKSATLLRRAFLAGAEVLLVTQGPVQGLRI